MTQKIRVNNPFLAVGKTGGCTFEPHLGWWTQISSEDQLSLGTPFDGSRDAIYIPTLQKTGPAVSKKVVENLKAKARELGLTEVTQASGMWVLSHNGQVQAETIWIFYSRESVNREALSKLAEQIKEEANQDSVAFEDSGTLNFV
jgi:hypothetical protein